MKICIGKFQMIEEAAPFPIVFLQYKMTSFSFSSWSCRHIWLQCPIALDDMDRHLLLRASSLAWMDSLDPHGVQESKYWRRRLLIDRQHLAKRGFFACSPDDGGDSSGRRSVSAPEMLIELRGAAWRSSIAHERKEMLRVCGRSPMVSTVDQ